MKTETRKTLFVTISILVASLTYGVLLSVIYPTLKDKITESNILNSLLVVLIVAATILFWFKIKEPFKGNKQNATILFVFFSTIITFFIVKLNAF